MKPDTRIPYGARCTWWDSIDNVGRRETPSGAIPCCPHCMNVLFEVESEKVWFESVDRHEANGNPGYRAMVEWSRGKCFRSYGDLKAAYAERAKGGGA
jgi:hypothetical protein